MKSEKKVLLKNYKALIEDLLDNYEEYTEEEKAQVKDIFQKTADLTKILDKYDIETEFSWQEYFNSMSAYFGAN